jgi:hypothetical protein
MPAARERYHGLRRPASENLHWRKPREGVRAAVPRAPDYGDLTAVRGGRSGREDCRRTKLGEQDCGSRAWHVHGWAGDGISE